MRIKKTREYCLEHHLCIRCKVRHTFKYKLCKVCRENNAKYNRERKELYKMLDLCLRCGGQKEKPQYSLCDACRENQRLYKQARRHPDAVA